MRSNSKHRSPWFLDKKRRSNTIANLRPLNPACSQDLHENGVETATLDGGDMKFSTVPVVRRRQAWFASVYRIKHACDCNYIALDPCDYVSRPCNASISKSDDSHRQTFFHVGWQIERNEVDECIDRCDCVSVGAVQETRRKLSLRCRLRKWCVAR